MKKPLILVFALLVLACSTHRVTAMPRVPVPGNPDIEAATRATRSLLIDLVAAETTNPPGNEARAVALGAARLDEAGIPYEITEFAPGRSNLVARLTGNGSAPPLLLLAHIAVVGADGQDWSVPPHTVTEKDGFLYGRGVADDLGMAAVGLEVLILLARSGLTLERDVIVAWTGDEESGGAGLRWLLENRPESIEAGLAINEGGGIVLGEDGKPARVRLQTAEKTYQDFTLTTYGRTGHSSVPLRDNAIYRLSRALDRIGRHRFPARLLPVTQANFAARAPMEESPLAEAMATIAASRGTLPKKELSIIDRNPSESASLRTTCVATQIAGGTRANALPARVEATINCRILPGQSIAAIEGALVRMVGDPEVEFEASDDFGGAPASPLDGPGPEAIAATVEEMWPGLPIVPYMSRGATDSRYLRARGIPAYGISPIALSAADGLRAHGADERIPEASLQPAVEFLYRLVTRLAVERPAISVPDSPDPSN